MRYLYTLFALVLALIFCSCASTSTVSRTEQCVSNYKTAKEKYDAEKYWAAKEKLDEVVSNCSGTGVMEDAHFLIGETHFRLEEWMEARAEYGSFVNFFPGSPYTETAAYRKAISAYNMSYKDSRDQSNTMFAIRDFERFLLNYPSSVLVDSVNSYLDSLQNREAERDYQIAKLYYKMSEPGAAAIYLKELLEEFPKSPRWKDAATLLVNSYIRMNEFASAKFYLEKLRNSAEQDSKVQEAAKKMEAEISNAESSMVKRLDKERKQKLQRKDEGV